MYNTRLTFSNNTHTERYYASKLHFCYWGNLTPQQIYQHLLELLSWVFFNEPSCHSTWSCPALQTFTFLKYNKTRIGKKFWICTYANMCMHINYLFASTLCYKNYIRSLSIYNTVSAYIVPWIWFDIISLVDHTHHSDYIMMVQDEVNVTIFPLPINSMCTCNTHTLHITYPKLVVFTVSSVSCR